MFTGIVQQVGSVAAVQVYETGLRLHVDPLGWRHRPGPGDSIAVNGCCLTVSAIEPSAWCFDVVHQTMRTTTLGALTPGEAVNLEHAVTPQTLLGGHIMQGHIDDVGTIEGVDREHGEMRVRIRPPHALLDYIVEKGSIAVDGVSLTVASLRDGAFEVALIPTTLRETTLGRVEAGRRVNLETDYVARTVVHWLKRREARQ